MKYLASVIIPTFNRSLSLEWTLTALARQTAKKDSFEVIVADDGSSEDTMAVIRKFEGSLSLKYGYYPDSGYHVTRARNLGIGMAEGEVIIFLDCGNLAASTFVERHIAAHRGHDLAVIGYIYGFEHYNKYENEMLQVLNVGDIDSSIAVIKSNAALLDVREEFYALCEDKIDDISASWTLYWGGNISVRARHARAVGGFDEWFRAWGAEDIDFGLALSRHGLPIKLVRDAVVVQYPHPKSMDERRAGYRLNKQHMHDKWQLPETEMLVKVGDVALMKSSIEMAMTLRRREQLLNSA